MVRGPTILRELLRGERSQLPGTGGALDSECVSSRPRKRLRTMTSLTKPDPSKDRVNGQRNGALDGLRGLAAFSVFLSHAQGMIPATALMETLRSSPARILWDGAAAVSLFFVLSGFVLALPFIGPIAKRLDVADFLVRRVFRIYPAYLVAIGLSLLLRLHARFNQLRQARGFRAYGQCL